MSTALSVGIRRDIDFYSMPKTLASRHPALQFQMRSPAVQVPLPARPVFGSPGSKMDEAPMFLATAAVETRPSPASRSWWLAAALRALEEIDDEIAEDGLPEIGPSARKEAERVIAALAWHPWDPTVYPTQDAEIAIQFQSRDIPNSVVILLDNHGRAECYAYTGGHSRRAHYDVASDLPDGFVMEQLRAMMPERTLAAPPEGIGSQATILGLGVRNAL